LKKTKLVITALFLSVCSVIPALALHQLTERNVTPTEKIDSDTKIEDQALEYFKAVLEEDVETIFKYVHPANLADGMTKEIYVEKLIKPQLKDLKGEFQLVSLEIVEVAGYKGAGDITNIVKHKTMMSVQDGKTSGRVEFDGLMKVYKVKGKVYFIGLNQGILESFGLEGIKDDE
jgi:hypothetical protein